MDIIYLLIPLSLILVLLAAWAFFWAVGSGQFDDLDSPAMDILDDDVEQARVGIGEESENEEHSF